MYKINLMSSDVIGFICVKYNPKPKGVKLLSSRATLNGVGKKLTMVHHSTVSQHCGMEHSQGSSKNMCHGKTGRL